MVTEVVLELVTVIPATTITVLKKLAFVVPVMDCDPVLKVAPPAVKEAPLLVIPP